MGRAKANRRNHARDRRRAQQIGAVGVVLAAVLPVALWWEVIRDVWRTFQPDATHILAWAPWALMALGILCSIPMAVEHLRDRERRFHRRGQGAWAGWGVTLYILGFALASQVAQMHAVGAG